MNDKIFDIPFVRGMSVVVPKEILKIEDLNFEGVNFKSIIKTTGIKEVRRAPANMTATDYCIAAAENLFADLNFDKAQIDGVIFATTVPDYLSPGNGYILQDRLNLSKKCIIVDINQACAGFVNGLFQAFLMVQSGYCKNVLLCAGDIFSRYLNSKDKSGQVIFSDAGAVALISANEILTRSAFSFYNDGNVFKALYMPAGGLKMQRQHGLTDVEKTDSQGNVHTLENLNMDGLEVMAFVLAAAPTAIKDVLKIINWQKDDVKIFALHQANMSIINALTKRLKVPVEKVPVSLTNYGNTTACSTPLTLCLEHPAAKEIWDKVIMCAFGTGMACAAVALDLSKTHFCKVQEL